MTKEEQIYSEIQVYAADIAVELGSSLRSRQIDAVLRAVARFLAQQPGISSPDILRAQKIADEMNRTGLAGGMP